MFGDKIGINGAITQPSDKPDTFGESTIKDLTQASLRLSYLAKAVEERYKAITTPLEESKGKVSDKEVGVEDTSDNLRYFSRMQAQISNLNKQMEVIQSVLDRCEL